MFVVTSFLLCFLFICLLFLWFARIFLGRSFSFGCVVTFWRKKLKEKTIPKVSKITFQVDWSTVCESTLFTCTQFVFSLLLAEKENKIYLGNKMFYSHLLQIDFLLSKWISFFHLTTKQKTRKRRPNYYKPDQILVWISNCALFAN